MTQGHVYGTCIQSMMLHASEIWPMTTPGLQRLLHNNRAMIRWICNIKPEDVATVHSNELSVWLSVEGLHHILRESRLCRYGHVEHSISVIKCAHDFQVKGK